MCHVLPLGGELLVGVILGGVDRGVLGPRGVLLPDILQQIFLRSSRYFYRSVQIKNLDSVVNLKLNSTGNFKYFTVFSIASKKTAHFVLD